MTQSSSKLRSLERELRALERARNHAYCRVVFHLSRALDNPSQSHNYLASRHWRAKLRRIWSAHDCLSRQIEGEKEYLQQRWRLRILCENAAAVIDDIVLYPRGVNQYVPNGIIAQVREFHEQQARSNP